MAIFNEELQVDLLFSGDIFAVHVMDVFPSCPAVQVLCRISRMSGMPLAICGLGFLVRLSASKWTRIGNGMRNCGRNSVRVEELN